MVDVESDSSQSYRLLLNIWVAALPWLPPLWHNGA